MENKNSHSELLWLYRCFWVNNLPVKMDSSYLKLTKRPFANDVTQSCPKFDPTLPLCHTRMTTLLTQSLSKGHSASLPVSNSCISSSLMGRSFNTSNIPERRPWSLSTYKRRTELGTLELLSDPSVKVIVVEIQPIFITKISLPQS